MFRGRSPGSKDKIRVGGEGAWGNTDSRVTSKDYSFVILHSKVCLKLTLFEGKIILPGIIIWC
jgi:hypothetical protein